MAPSSKHRDLSPPSSRNPWGMAVAIFLIVIIVVLTILARLSRPSAAEQRQAFAASVSPLGASADSALIVVGTLAPLGSFDYETAPLVNRLTVLKRHAADAFLRNEISRDQAAEVQAKGDETYAVIAAATRVCSPAPHTGKCTGSRRQVDELLGEAKRDAASITDYTSGVSY